MQRKGGSDLRNRELDVMNEIDIIESKKKSPSCRKMCAFDWVGSLRLNAMNFAKATHLDIVRRNILPPMLMKKIFFLARTKNVFLTKERLSDYAIKRKRPWPKIFISSTTVLKCYRKSTMISSIQAFKIMYHPCTAIWGESSRRSARSSCFLYKRGQYYSAVS